MRILITLDDMERGDRPDYWRAHLLIPALVPEDAIGASEYGETPRQALSALVTHHGHHVPQT